MAKKEEETHPLHKNLKFWEIIIGIILAIGGGAYFLGVRISENKFDDKKIELTHENDRLRSDSSRQGERIAYLSNIYDDLLKKNSLGSIPPKQPSGYKLHHKGPQLTSDKTHEEDQLASDNNSDANEIKIQNLKAENKKLKQDLNKVSSEKADLKRRVLKYLSKQDSLITELEILKDEIRTAQGEDRENDQKKFNELLAIAREVQNKFDETQDNADINKEVEDAKNNDAELERKNKEMETLLASLQKQLNDAKTGNAELNFTKAQSILSAAEGTFNWFGVNNDAKCKLILQVKEIYENCTKSGKDCSKILGELLEKYKKCF